MALATLGTLDISAVTSRLLELVTAATEDWPQWDPTGPVEPFTIKVSGASPDSVRAEDYCQLTLSLLHLAPNKFQANAATNGRALVGDAPPLALDLYYLLTAFAKDNYLQEQRALSIGVRAL